MRFDVVVLFSMRRAHGWRRFDYFMEITLMIVNVMNAFGERQHPKTFISKCVGKVLSGEKVHIHSYPDQKRAGMRFYIHTRNIACAVQFLLKNGSIGEKYNITGEKEVDNLVLARWYSRVGTRVYLRWDTSMAL